MTQRMKARQVYIQVESSDEEDDASPPFHDAQDEQVVEKQLPFSQHSRIFPFIKHVVTILSVIKRVPGPKRRFSSD